MNDESQHLLIRGVPSVNLHDEVEKLCTRYGDVSNIRQIQFEDQEEFTHSFHVTFARIHSARYLFISFNYIALKYILVIYNILDLLRNK